MQVQFLSLEQPAEEMLKHQEAARGAEGPLRSALSLLLLLVAGTGCPAAHHLAPDLLHELWVLLLHLLCKLLARLDETGQVTVLRTAAWGAQRVMASRDHS